MIYEQIVHARQLDALGDRFAKALRFITENPLCDMPDQRVDLDGERLFALLSSYETKAPGEMALEAHRRYVDLQYVFEGEELIYCAFLDEMKNETQPYNAENDIVFYNGSATPFVLRPDRFVLLWPNDVHGPSISVQKAQKVRKVVVKILIG